MSDPVLTHLIHARQVAVAKDRRNSLAILAFAITLSFSGFIARQLFPSAESAMNQIEQNSPTINCVLLIVLSLMTIFSGWFHAIINWDDAIDEYKKAVQK